MKLVARFLHWFCNKYMTLHPIWRDGVEIYMARYHTKEKQEDASWFIHNIRLADEDGNHNHPYEWQVSVILCSSYIEEVLDTKTGKRTYHKRRWLNWIRGDRYHRIVELRGDVWTLFIHGPKHGKSWGFWDYEFGHVHNREYRAPKDCNGFGPDGPIFLHPSSDDCCKRGWYFITEIWGWAGPYATREECKTQFSNYCKEYL